MSELSPRDYEKNQNTSPQILEISVSSYVQYRRSEQYNLLFVLVMYCITARKLFGIHNDILNFLYVCHLYVQTSLKLLKKLHFEYCFCCIL